MRSRFVIVNAAMIGVLVAYWRLGLFALLPAFSWVELLLVGTLFAYGVFGLLAAAFGKWETAAHIANNAPRWGLPFTGLGLIVVFSGQHTDLFRLLQGAIFAVLPNVVGGLILSWLTEIEWWCRE